MAAAGMESFWDARAREDALYFVDDRRPYRSAEEGSFWSDGERDLDEIFAALDVRIEPGTRIVDIGCGVGRLTRVLARRAAEVVAIDVSAEMLSRARDLNPHLTNVRWIHGNGVDLRPIEDASVDGCVSNVVFQHIPDPRVTLGYVTEMGRILRGDGFAAFQISNDPGLHAGRPERPNLRARLDQALRRRPRGRRNAAWRGSAVDLDDLRRHAAAAGLEIERIVGAGTQYCIVRARRA